MISPDTLERLRRRRRQPATGNQTLRPIWEFARLCIRRRVWHAFIMIANSSASVWSIYYVMVTAPKWSRAVCNRWYMLFYANHTVFRRRIFNWSKWIYVCCDVLSSMLIFNQLLAVCLCCVASFSVLCVCPKNRRPCAAQLRVNRIDEAPSTRLCN